MGLPLGARLCTPTMWDTRGWQSCVALPLAAVYAGVAECRTALAPPPFRAAATVICVGSVLVGGTFKTPVSLDILGRLALRDPTTRVHVLSRGYAGSARGPLRVRQEQHAANTVGDEALLLSRVAPTWIGARRRASAAVACAHGAELLLMDDGLQHTGLYRDLSLLCIDTSYLLGNGQMLPAGPLREPLGRALARSHAVVGVSMPLSQPHVSAFGTGGEGGLSDEALRAKLAMPHCLPLLRPRLVPESAAAEIIAGRRVFAFSGTARPRRFFDTLRELGCTMAVPPCALPDHAPLPAVLVARLRAAADAASATLVTTAKDAARLSSEQLRGVHVLPVRLDWCEADNQRLDSLIDGAVAASRSHLLTTPSTVY